MLQEGVQAVKILEILINFFLKFYKTKLKMIQHEVPQLSAWVETSIIIVNLVNSELLKKAIVPFC